MFLMAKARQCLHIFVVRLHSGTKYIANVSLDILSNSVADIQNYCILLQVDFEPVITFR